VRSIPPTEDASVGAPGHGGRHLEAAVAGNTVELLLIAETLISQALLRPKAQLHRRMIADDSIMLMTQNRANIRRDHFTERFLRIYTLIIRII
jgi:hypothetical protein